MSWTLNAVEVAEILDIPQSQANEFIESRMGEVSTAMSTAITRVVNQEFFTWRLQQSEEGEQRNEETDD